MFIKGYQWQCSLKATNGNSAERFWEKKNNFTDNYNCNYGELLPQRSRH